MELQNPNENLNKLDSIKARNLESELVPMETNIGEPFNPKKEDYPTKNFPKYVFVGILRF